MTLSSQEFRKKPLSPSQPPQKSCLKNNNNNNNNNKNDFHDDDNDDSLVSTSDEGGETESFDCDSSSSFFMLGMGKKVVTFGSIEVREYPIILGDNPSPTDGVPVTIGWKPQRRGMFDSVDSYEQKFHPNIGHPFNNDDERRHGKDLLLDAKYRAQLALYGGATLVQIGKTAVEITKIQKHRAQSSQKGPLELLREGFDRTLHPNRRLQQPSKTFTRVPNEAPRILSAWKANGDKLIMYANAAA